MAIDEKEERITEDNTVLRRPKAFWHRLHVVKSYINHIFIGHVAQQLLILQTL